jgi:hypothetical protein
LIKRRALGNGLSNLRNLIDVDRLFPSIITAKLLLALDLFRSSNQIRSPSRPPDALSWKIRLHPASFSALACARVSCWSSFETRA